MIRKLVVFLLLVLTISSCSDAQSVVQTWVDPCTNTVQTATFPVSGPGVLIMYRGQSRAFTAQQAISGELLVWINQVTVNIPCPITNNPVVTQTATQTATQAATQAASAAASAAASSAASSSAGAAATGAASSAAATPAPTATPAQTSTPQESAPSSSASSESSSSEPSSESKSEEKSEEKKEEKKSGGGRTNPLLVASDFTTGQNPDGSLSALFTTGVSQSSLAGDKSYGATAIVWMTFDQGAISANYSKMKFDKGKLQYITSYANTLAYLKGTWMNMSGVTLVKPDPKWGVVGISGNVILLATPDQINDEMALSYATSIAAFWMHNPISLNERVTLSPQIFIMGAPVSYNDMTKFTFNDDLSAMIGNSIDYKITRRFGMTGAHRVMVPSTGKPMHFLLIGSRVTL